jgi:hypothetical protein
VPTGCGRPGPHPLLELTSPYLRLRPARLAMWPGRQGRDLDIQRFYAERTLPQADVLLLDDTWVSGASAQSAAAALKLAGARRVAIVVLARHLDPADPRTARLLAALRPGRYDPSTCAVHPSRPGVPGLRLTRPTGPKLDPCPPIPLRIPPWSDERAGSTGN